MLIAPDKPETTTRYGILTLGDGNEYRIARGGFGRRGAKLEELYDSLRDVTSTADVRRIVRQAFHVVMEPFYDDGRIITLLDNDQIGVEHSVQMWRIVEGDDIEVKKNSSELSSGLSSGV